MAIKWKTSIPEWTDMTSNGTIYTLCGSDDDMSSIKSINFVNGNPTAYGVSFSVWVDTSQMETTSPEYSPTPIYLLRRKKISGLRNAIYSSIINNATWSSKGAILKCAIEVPIAWTPVSTQGNYFAGSIILSGQENSSNTPNFNQF